MPLDPLAERLKTLLAVGSIAASELSPSMRKRLEPLFWINALQENKAGSGKRVMLSDREAMNRWLMTNYPSGLEGTSEQLPPRAESVANFRDSKAGRPLRALPVFMRGFGSSVLLRGSGELPLAALTKAYNLAGILVDRIDPWQFSGVLALVENFEVFMNVEAVVPDIDAALWTVGRLKQRVLDWLGAMPQLSVVHVGDYDPVGLDDYMRVCRALSPTRARLFVPDDLEARLARYGKRDLLMKSVAVLERVRRDGPEDVQRVIAIIDRHGKALEQEALMIPASDEREGRPESALT